jgi:hypothetical protein
MIIIGLKKLSRENFAFSVFVLFSAIPSIEVIHHRAEEIIKRKEGESASKDGS